MFNVNQYFEGNVMSMAFENEEGKATVGIMAPGEYEFGTSTIELMTVISGEMTVLLPGESEWKTYQPFETFRVEKDAKFKLVIKEDCAYKCLYK
ncbi:MAG TPA: pyrimidine/purine nucleoside phosphorylase [Prolixibacteraceae bacterium]|nr:pyrimidine/purine nucleoside phosphorylase [Prolixibacteraceae bacterium]HPS12112.1 pyrimidine/purine nucleoside phosphorylase [Prolixibacteraceae bacterium]